jgi:xylose isomerase
VTRRGPARSGRGFAALRQPTRNAGETVAELLVDRTAYEEYDYDAAGARGYRFVRLNELAIEHFGAR